MGLYHETYLCSGKFNNKSDVIINKKFKIATCDNIIENHEWINGYVKKDDLINFLRDTPIKILESDTCDLFLEEDAWTMEETIGSKYILVEKNCSYTN